jgi:hypothetical protein
MPILNVAFVIFALVGMLALGRLLARALDMERETGSRAGEPRTETGQGAAIDTADGPKEGVGDDRSSATKTRAGARARAIYIAPKMVLPHGDTQVISLVGWKRRAR